MENSGRGAGAKLRPAAAPRLLLALSVGALAVAVGAALSLLLLPGARVRILPDGSKVALEGVTFGSQHEFDWRPWWDRLLNRSPVGPTGAPVPVAVPSLITSPGSLVVWLHQTAGTQSHAPAGYGVITDPHGCWFEPSAGVERTFWRGPGLAPLRAVEFGAYPRRETSANFGLYDAYGRGPSVRYQVPTRRVTAVPWEPGSVLPATVENGGLTFTLRSLKHREVLRRRREAAVFDVTRNGKLQGDWCPFYVTVRDATGNVVSSPTHGRMDDGTVRFSGLCRREPSWKLDVSFERTRAGRTLETRTVKFIIQP